jgi:hypothetical protein
MGGPGSNDNFCRLRPTNLAMSCRLHPCQTCLLNANTNLTWSWIAAKSQMASLFESQGEISGLLRAASWKCRREVRVGNLHHSYDIEDNELTQSGETTKGIRITLSCAARAGANHLKLKSWPGATSASWLKYVNALRNRCRPPRTTWGPTSGAFTVGRKGPPTEGDAIDSGQGGQRPSRHFRDCTLPDQGLCVFSLRSAGPSAILHNIPEYCPTPEAEAVVGIIQSSTPPCVRRWLIP